VTRATVNHAIWAAGLVLQFGLLALMFLRRIAGRIPSFTVLLTFYPLRAAVLYFLVGHLAPDDYLGLYRGLALVALALVLAAVIELSWRLWKLLPRARWGLLATPFVAALIAESLWSILPMKSLVPADRIEMFGSAMMVLLCGFALAGRAPEFLRKVLVGLGVFGLVDLMATAGKNFAAQRRDGAMFAGWSYANTSVYVLVVLFWMLSLRSEESE
jgi:hypothetical protein